MVPPSVSEPAQPFDPADPAAADRLLLAAREVEAMPRRKDQLLPALLTAQHALGWLPPAAITHVAEHIRVPASEVYASATGYSELLLERPVPGTWRVCTGVACDLAGARALLTAVSGVSGAYIRPTDCQFLCALAPVVVDDAECLYGRVTAERIARLVADGSAR